MSTRPPTDWKEKYLTALEDEERRKKQSQQIMALLSRAIIRISLVADGLDGRLDQQLTGLRKMLTTGAIPGSQLKMLVNALDGHVKRLDSLKSQRSATTLKAFKSMSGQLKGLKPGADLKKKLNQFEKPLKTRSAHLQEYSALVSEYSVLQQQVLAALERPSLSKPFWHRWPADTSPLVTAPDGEELEVVIAEEVDESLEEYSRAGTGGRESRVIEESGVGLDLSDDVSAPRAEKNPEHFAEEPTYSRLNHHIRQVLSELLDGIDPPSLAQENYRSARNQIEAGLPWYELIPTLEDISLVVVTAFDSREGEFEAYLGKLNERLTEAFDDISRSKKVLGEGAAAARLFNSSLRESMLDMRLRVAGSTELDQLKNQVSGRLDQIVATMDSHQLAEQQREQALTEQLDTLVERVKRMEQESEVAEKRIEEQRQRALRDVLTQLPNREAYELRLHEEYERWKRYQRPLSMVICDIDLFKRVNDGYGHLAGDKVLRIIAKTLSTRLRETDFIARYGGEEFVILMPETHQDKSLIVAEGIREAIANCPFHFKDEKVEITMSFGVTEYVAGDNPDSAFARGDKALYAAKEGGRNRCVLAELEDEVEAQK